jgi:hypothetical protein
MTFKDIKPGDTFKVDSSFDSSFEDEWFLRGHWMRTTLGRLCVCLTQGVSNQGATKRWKDDTPVEIVRKRHLP